MSRLRALALVISIIAAALAVLSTPSGAAMSASISGVAFRDHDRNGHFDAGDEPFAGHQLYLFSGTTLVDTVATADDGSYTFEGLAPGDYLVRYASSSWKTIRDDWVPTTTGSVWPEWPVSVVDSAVAEFGWRRISRSTTLGLPMSSYTGAEGLHVESYTDAVHAQTIHARLLAGSLIGDEASSTKIRFGYHDVSATTSAVQSSGGEYTGYSATVAVTYHSWLDGYDETLFHEYGHAWAGYFGYLIQQDPELTGYLDVRGLTGDSRVNSSYAWNVGEMIAEDYRQLFGTGTAASAAQTNRDIPEANEVPGLADYLSGAFRSGSADGGTTDGGTTDGGTTDGGTTDGGTTDTKTNNGKGGGGKDGTDKPGGGNGGGKGKLK